MDFHILGPLEVLDEGRAIALAGSRQRALLGVLLLHANETLSTDRLIDELWGANPPATATKSVHVHISRLRKTLASNGDPVVVTRAHGYELTVDPERLDVHRFERLLAEGRNELAAGRPQRAVEVLERALSLWRGAPLGDVGGEPFAKREIARLDDLHVTALEQLVEARLALGGHADVVGMLEKLIAEHPYREGLRAQLMLALYRWDRQAEALQAYQDARRKLVEDLGIEPGERLRDLERAILAQDPALALTRRDAADLPRELDTRVPLVGRDAELAWLREHWRCASGGAGRLVLVAGAKGIGKSRLVSELALEVHRGGGTVRCVPGADAADAVRATPGPALLVCDDVDRARDAALGDLADALAERPVLVVATAESPAVGVHLGAAATLALAPLDAAAMRAVAGLYTSARPGAEMPIEQLAEASGGVPQQVHRVAGEWAHAAAADRVGAAARRAAAERTGLRAAEDDVAGDVIELQAARERRDLDTERVVACPFKGLDVFDVDDADVFFGRERLIAEMVARLAGAPMMGIVGSSGSGKSSALRAGLLASLAAGVLPGSERWTQVLLRPGEQPTRALERATDDGRQHERRIVAVDQFEELFTACPAESERAAFVEALLGLAREPGRRTLVLVAMRADFYGRCAVYPELARLLGANHVLVGPMRRAELRRAIELPAERAGLAVDPDLVDALIADVEGEPGSLPLLSTALLELWRHRDGRALRMAAYEQTGGVQGAIARLAESAYARLDPERRAIARRILLRLAGEGEGDAAVRRRVPLGELEADRDEQVGEVLAALAADRLVTVGDGEVEVAHEALLREWPRLRGWLDEDAQGRRLRVHLRDAARQWDASGRESGELYRGARLASALDWAVGHDAELNGTERAFLRDSRAASVRAQRRLRAVLAGVAALLVIAVAAGLVALNQRGSARERAIAADAQRLGASALAEDRLDRALLLARQGVALDDTVQTRANLLATLLKSPAALGVLRGDGQVMTTLRLSPDERTLAAGTAGNEIFLFDTRTRRRIATLEPTPIRSWITGMAFSPDGGRLAVGYDVETYGNKIAVFDAGSGRVVERIRPPRDRFVSGLVYSQDGRTLDVIAPRFQDDRPPIFERFDARTGRRLLGPVPISPDGRPTTLLTSDGRRLVAVGERETMVRDVATLRVLDRFPFGSADGYALSSDDHTLALAGEAGSVRLLDLRTGAVRTADGHHGATISRVAFTPDGRTLVTTGEDGRIVLWDVQTATTTGETMSGHSGEIDDAMITRDGRTLYTSSADGTVLMWDLAGDRRLGRPFTAGTGDLGRAHLALSSDGRLIVMGQADGSISIVDARTLARRGSLPVVTTGQAMGIGFLPGSHVLVVGGPKGFLALVDVDRGQVVRRLRGHRGGIFTPGISADGRLLATGSDDNTVRLWSLPDGRQLGAPLRPRQTVNDVQLSPDGRWVTVATHDRYFDKGRAEIWSVRTRRRVRTLPVPEMTAFMRFSPDGRFLVTGYSRGRAQVWSTTTWRPVTRLLTADAATIDQAAISPDDRTLAAGSDEGMVRLWDIATEQPVGVALPGLPAHAVLPYFTPDGTHVIASYDTGRAYFWDIRAEALARRACAIAGRPLTRTEWSEVLPDRAYSPACTG